MKKEINDIKTWIISKLILNPTNFTVEDIIKEIIISDNDCPGIDINLFIEDNDETFNYDLWKIANIAFICNIDNMLEWLLSIKNKFLKYTKTYYSDFSFIDLLISLKDNHLTLDIELQKQFIFANNDDLESDYYTNIFECEINNFTKDQILKLKW